MIEDIEIRRAVPGDLPAVEAFIAKTYGPTAPHKGGQRWSWQFLDTPFYPDGEPVNPTVWIACAGARVVGQIALQEGRFRMNGEAHPASWIVDVMIDPEFRGIGLGHRIHAALMRERSVLITLTMAVATRRIAEKAGCITLGETWQYLAALRLSGHTIRRYLKGRGQGRFIAPLIRAFSASMAGPAVISLGLRLTGKFKRHIWRHGTAPVGRIDEVADFGPEFDALWHSTCDDHAPVFERNTTFLNWRFCAAPGLSYQRFALRDADGLQGYVVTRLGDPVELPLGVIADIYARNGDADVLDTLLAHARDVLSDCEFIEAAASDPRYRQALSRAGFIATRRMRPTIVCTDQALKARLAQRLEGWHFTKADHDWDQVHPADD